MSENLTSISEAIAGWKSDEQPISPQLDPKTSPLLLYKGPEYLVKGSIDDMPEAFRHLEDGRMYFAVDTKKIYVDCNFTSESNGQTYSERLSFGGNNGIFFGRRTFDEDELAEKRYWFYFEDGDLEDNRDDVPQIDDLILNIDGCFYRVNNVRHAAKETWIDDGEGNKTLVVSDIVYTIIETKQLTLAGTGGGGGGNYSSSQITPSRNPESPTTFIKASNSIPISFRVTDSDSAVTTLTVDIYINQQYIAQRSISVSHDYQQLDLARWSSYFNTNTSTNEVKLVFKDEHDSTNVLYFRGLNLVDLVIAVDQANLGRIKTTSYDLFFRPYGGTSMASWQIKARLNPPNQGNSIIETFTSDKDKGAQELYQIKNLNVYGEGSYTLDMWIEAYPNEESSEMLTSPITTVQFIYSSENSTALNIAASLEGQSNILTQYSTAVISYTVAYGGSDTSNVHLVATCDGTTVVDTNSTVENDKPAQWRVPLRLAGTYTFVISIDALSYSTSIDNIVVVAPQESVPVINTNDSSLQLYLTADGKDNAQTDRNVWTWTGTNNNTITSSFEHFNWSTDGWQTDEQGVTSLHLSNGAKLTVNFAPFAAANTNGNGAQERGKTIEFDFKVSNVRDTSQILINAASWDPRSQKVHCGIVGQGDRISMNAPGLTNYRSQEEDLILSEEEKAKTNGLRAYVTDNKRVTVAFVIQAQGDESDKSLIYVYINGVLSGLTDYVSKQLLDYDNEVPAYIVFDSTYGDIDLYNVRVYGKKLTDDEILNNYAANLPTLEERLNCKINNKVLSNTNEISLDEVVKAGNIPYIVFTDCRKTSDKKGKKGIQDQSPKLPTGKKDFRWCEFYYVDPQHEDRNIGDINNKVVGVLYGQGTSSMDYPVKNLRLRIREPQKLTVPEDATPAQQAAIAQQQEEEDARQAKYSLLPAIPIENLNSDNEQEKAAAEAEQEYWENIPPVRLFTFKADYMDSSMAHNTGTGNVLAALYKSINLYSPTQKYYNDKTIVTNVVGSPCIGFYQPWGSQEAPKFAGRFNFNLDKAEHDLFGFKEDVKFKTVEGETTTEIAQCFGRARTGTYTDPNNENAVETWGAGETLKWGFHGTTDEEYDSSKVYYNSPSVDGNGDPNDIWQEGESQETREAAFKARVGYKDAAGEKVNGTGPALYEYVLGPSTIQCWEFKNNAMPMVRFQGAFEDTLANQSDWVGSFESRYPEYMTEYASDKRGFMRLVNWLNSTNQLQALTQEEFDEYITNDAWTPIREACEAVHYDTKIERYNWLIAHDKKKTQEFIDLDAEIAALRDQLGDTATKYDIYSKKVEVSRPTFDPPRVIDGVTYNHDLRDYRLAKFKNEIRQYMNLRMTLFYYVITEAFLMVDSRAKNMMMCCCDCDMDAGVGHWFPIFYDMDTILGVDNKGMLRFPYDTDDETDTLAFNATANYGYFNNGEWIENGRASALWANLREAFATDISSLYNQLRANKKFDYNFLTKSYDEKEATSFAEIYDNKDAKYKYIDTYGKQVEGASADAAIAAYLYAAQGTRALHREFFLKHRFTLLDGKYPDRVGALDYNTTKADIKLRLYDTSVVGNDHPDANRRPGGRYYHRFCMKSPSTQYGVFQPCSANALDPVKIEPEVPTWTPQLVGVTVSDQEAYLFYLGDVYDLGDMSGMFPSTFNVQRKLKLRRLHFGNASPQYKSSTVLSMGPGDFANLPLLEYLNIRNKKLTMAPELGDCHYFQTLLASGSDITEVTLPVGGNLKRLELPEYIQNVTIRNHLYYDTFHQVLDEDGETLVDAFTCDDYGNISTLWIEGCPLVDSLTIVKRIMNARMDEQTGIPFKMSSIRMPDLSWDIYPVDCTITNDVISDIPALDFISRTSYGLGSDGKTTSANTYINGVIRIHNGTVPVSGEDTSIGVDVYAINKKYGSKFPSLRIEYDDNPKNITGYYINIYDLNGGKIVARNNYQNSIVIGADDILGENDTPQFNFGSYLSVQVEIPDNGDSDNQWTYEFKGWKINKENDNTTQGIASEIDSVVNDNIDIHVTINDSDPTSPYMVTDLVDPYLTLADFDENLEINIYPVFKKHLRKFKVWFYMTEESTTPAVLNPEVHPLVDGQYQPVLVEYGTAAPTPSNEPVVVTLDQNDKTLATMKKMIRYDDHNGTIPLNRITSECHYYPIFDVEQRMDEITSPSTAYFETTSLTNTVVQDVLGLTPGENAVKATIKESYTGEAIVVPLKIDNKRVVTIANRSASVRRIFFEKDPETHSSNILYFLGDINADPNGFTKVIDDSNGVINSSDYINTTLEYIEFKACKQLKVIGGGFGGNSSTSLEFSNCRSLYVDELPDSVMWIGPSTFRNCIDVQLSHLPDSLVYIGQKAFMDCTGLGFVDVSTYNPPQGPYEYKIDASAFSGCENLTFGDTYYFRGWKIIGDSAFKGCTQLRAFNDSGTRNGDTVTTIGEYAFQDCINLGLLRLPSNLQQMYQYAFALGRNRVNGVSEVVIPIDEIGQNVNYIGKNVFYKCKIMNGNNGLTWKLNPLQNPTVHRDAFVGMTSVELKFGGWGNPDAVYADYEEGRDPEWQFAKVSPWWDNDNEEYLIPFGATSYVNGGPLPYTIQVTG